MKKALLASTLAIALAGCAGAAIDEEYNKVVAQAEQEIKVANQMGFLWRDTEKFLKESKEAYEAGDKEKALKLAKKALKQAQLAQEQAKANANPVAKFNAN
jgi:predicted lipoprotein